MKNQETFWRVGYLPTLISAFLYFDVSFMVWVLLGALAGIAIVARVTLAVVQPDWIGVWIAKHGRVKTAEPVPPLEGAEAA